MKEPTQEELDALPTEKRLELINQRQQHRHQTLNSIGILFGVVFTAASLVATALTVRTSQDDLRTTKEGQITDRYTKAVEQLGSAKRDVRLGAIYALERIAADSPRDRPTIFAVLGVFAREHDPDPTTDVEKLPSEPETDVHAAIAVLARQPHIIGQPLDLHQIRTPGIQLVRANLRGANLFGADLTHANLTDGDLSYANLNDAKLGSQRGGDPNSGEPADLAGTNLTGADLRGADLGGAYGVDLERANLTGANLDEANLSSANGVDLTEANLTRAYLGFVDLTNANLSYANLTNANLSFAKLDGDLIKANLTGANLSGTRLGYSRGANLAGANLRGADLTKADLRHANLRGADLRNIRGISADEIRKQAATDSTTRF